MQLGKVVLGALHPSAVRRTQQLGRSKTAASKHLGALHEGLADELRPASTFGRPHATKVVAALAALELAGRQAFVTASVKLPRLPLAYVLRPSARLRANLTGRVHLLQGRSPYRPVRLPLCGRARLRRKRG